MHVYINVQNVSCVPQCPASRTSPTQTQAMRYHPQSPFGKAWAAYYTASGLDLLSEDDKRKAYDQFCIEWKQKLE
jgi:hypothetical protein